MHIDTYQTPSEQQRAGQFALLTHLMQECASCTDIESLSVALLSRLQQLVGPEFAALYQLSEGSRELMPIAELVFPRGEEGATKKREAVIHLVRGPKTYIHLDDPHAVVAQAVAGRETITRHSQLSRERGQGRELVGGPRFSGGAGEVAVPLMIGETIYGVLMLQRDTSLSDEELQSVEAFSAAAALLLDHLVLKQQVHKERDEVLRAQSRFLSTISHELRAPLNTMHGYLDLALDGAAGDLNEHLRDFLCRARASSEQLYAMLEDLLLIGRADAGQVRLNREIVRIQDVIEGAVEQLELTACDQRIAIIVEAMGPLPSLYGDAARLQHALRNLLSNAIQATAEGGSVTIAARVESSLVGGASDEQERRLVLMVRDTGEGIDPAYHERIFERFFQLPKGQGGRVKGQGLGLTTARLIVELHGGQLKVESTPGRGSTFICTFPHLLG